MLFIDKAQFCYQKSGDESIYNAILLSPKVACE